MVARTGASLAPSLQFRFESDCAAQAASSKVPRVPSKAKRGKKQSIFGLGGSCGGFSGRFRGGFSGGFSGGFRSGFRGGFRRIAVAFAADLAADFRWLDACFDACLETLELFLEVAQNLQNVGFF